MSAHTADLIEQARRLDGLYAGMCQPEEYRHLIAAGLLERDYSGPAGMLGVAKFRAAGAAIASTEGADR